MSVLPGYILGRAVSIVIIQLHYLHGLPDRTFLPLDGSLDLFGLIIPLNVDHPFLFHGQSDVVEVVMDDIMALIILTPVRLLIFINADVKIYSLYVLSHQQVK